jgi:hypothetical protein
MHQWNNCFLAHERLAIIDPASGGWQQACLQMRVCKCVLQRCKQRREAVAAEAATGVLV